MKSVNLKVTKTIRLVSYSLSINTYDKNSRGSFISFNKSLITTQKITHNFIHVTCALFVTDHCERVSRPLCHAIKLGMRILDAALHLTHM